jgi:hypothetical protein
VFKNLAVVAAVFGVVACGLSALAPAASAAPSAVIAGTGVLDAHGNGLVAVKGNIDMRASASEGILLVKDESGDAFVHVEGHGDVVRWNGFTLYFGFHGDATVIGRGVAVIVLGKDVDVHAAGRGWAYLKGNGSYFVNGHGPFPWNADGGFASVTPDAAPAAP